MPYSLLASCLHLVAFWSTSMIFPLSPASNCAQMGL